MRTIFQVLPSSSMHACMYACSMRVCVYGTVQYAGIHTCIRQFHILGQSDARPSPRQHSASDSGREPSRLNTLNGLMRTSTSMSPTIGACSSGAMYSRGRQPHWSGKLFAIQLSIQGRGAYPVREVFPEPTHTQAMQLRLPQLTRKLCNSNSHNSQAS